MNYDGQDKHHTTVGSHCRTGSDNMFVAPVTVGDGAYTAAGSVITKDVPAGSLAVARGQQRNIEGWVARKRPGARLRRRPRRLSGTWKAKPDRKQVRLTRRTVISAHPHPPAETAVAPSRGVCRHRAENTSEETVL